MLDLFISGMSKQRDIARSTPSVFPSHEDGAGDTDATGEASAAQSRRPMARDTSDIDGGDLDDDGNRVFYNALFEASDSEPPTPS